VTTVETPPRPQPSQDELEALIEEARRRTRRRRLLIAAGAAMALAVAGGVALLVGLTRGGGSAQELPAGFRIVQARGPVQHALLQDLHPSSRTIDLRSGRVRPTRVTQEIWWDPRGGFARTVYRADGAVADYVLQKCQGAGERRFCFPPSPFDLAVRGLGWPPKPHFAHVAQRGAFHGHRVVWVEGLVQPGGGAKPYRSGEQVAYNTVTHRPVALRSIVRQGPGAAVPAGWRGRVVNANAVKLLPDVAAARVSFAVPKRGAPRNANLKQIEFHKASLTRARAVLGRAPLWLGRTYRGHRLRFVQTGLMGSESADGSATGLAPVVRLDYGPFRIDEFGSARPIWVLRAPRPGMVVASSRYDLMFGRDGIVLNVAGPIGRGLDIAAITALAKALRPSPGG
jgi:hypothetical protein